MSSAVERMSPMGPGHTAWVMTDKTHTEHNESAVRLIADMGADDQSWELLPSVSQSGIKLNPNIIDARMTLMAIRTGFIGKRSRRCEHLGPI